MTTNDNLENICTCRLQYMLNQKEKKHAIALEMARSLGFESLDDFNTIVNKDNFEPSLAFLRLNRINIMKVFKERRLQNRLKKTLKLKDCIRIFRSICRDTAVRRSVYTKKLNCVINGKKTSKYVYKLMR